MRNEIKLWLRALVLTILCAPLYSLASNIGTLTSFSPGTQIQSAQVNGNFSAITTAVNSKQDNITGACPAGQAVTGVANVGGALTCAPAGLTFGSSTTGSAATSGVTVGNAGGGAGLEGDSSSASNNAYGVLGDLTALSPGSNAAGVKGQSEGGGIGVWGSTDGTNLFGSYGVYGSVSGGPGVGVLGTTDEGVGVWGETNSTGLLAAGVTATNNASQTGVALDISQGYLQVQGAGVNTHTTAFIWTAANAGLNGTSIDNPMTNGNPNLLLTVTQSINPVGIYNPHPIGVLYNGGYWNIINLDQGAMPVNASFVVLVVSP